MANIGHEAIPERTKTPSEMAYFVFDYLADAAILSGESITSFQVLVSPSSLLGVSSVSFNGSFGAFYVGSGVAGAEFFIDGAARTSNGRDRTSSFRLEIVSRRR